MKMINTDQFFNVKKSSKQSKRDKKRERRNEKIRKESLEKEKSQKEIGSILMMFSGNQIKSTIPNATRENIGKKEGVIVSTGDKYNGIKVNISDNNQSFIKVNTRNIEHNYKPTTGDQISIDITKVTFVNDNINYEITENTLVELIMSNDEYQEKKRYLTINNFIDGFKNIVIAKKCREETTNNGTEFYVFSMVHKMKTRLGKKDEVSVIKRFAREIESDNYLIKLPMKHNSTRGLKAMGITDSEMKDIISDYRNMCQIESQKYEKDSIKSIKKKSKKKTMSGFADAFSDSDDEDD